MTTQLQLYNDALLIVGERALASLTENREPRRLLDQVWSGGGVKFCLEQGQWFFAMCSGMLDYDTTIVPTFGYNYAFKKPDDWLLTSAVCSDEFFREPLTRYSDEAGFWYTDLQTIYVKYVSILPNYGMNIGAWPEAFNKYVAAYFASRICNKITQDENKTKLIEADCDRLLKDAKSASAMTQPTKFPAPGNWTRSRMRNGMNRDGGNTSGNLY